jgi:hypothetical protein
LIEAATSRRIARQCLIFLEMENCLESPSSSQILDIWRQSEGAAASGSTNETFDVSLRSPAWKQRGDLARLSHPVDPLTSKLKRTFSGRTPASMWAENGCRNASFPRRRRNQRFQPTTSCAPPVLRSWFKTWKSSLRVDVFRFARDSGHRATQAPCPFRAHKPTSRFRMRLHRSRAA